MSIFLSIWFLFSLSFGQIQRASLSDRAEIHDLRSKIPRDLTVELPDGSQRSMSRCDFVVLKPDAANIDPEERNQWKNLHRSNFLTIPVAFHVIYKTDYTGYILQSKLDAQIDILNVAFGDLDIQFQQYSVDYNANDDWFGIYCEEWAEPECNALPNHCEWNNNDGQCQIYNTYEDTYMNTLAVDPARTLNIYTAELGGTLGYAWLPTDLEYIEPYEDGVVLYILNL
jgi:hypothetical protein